MGARKPSADLIVDANIVLGMVLGARSRSTWRQAQAHRRLLMSVEAVTEVMTVASHMLDRLPTAVKRAEELIELLNVPSADRYDAVLDAARIMLRNAPASRNGSDKDAHILALAWSCDADIWSHDRDFAGTGWPSWSSANLAAALAEEAGRAVQPV
ncbi:MAG: PIN domain-containing protein [Hyphomicrobiales bacterium]|nr:MAG: PIN domain-containing protein [Hyphomicrobiales bacterium]